MVSIVEGEIDQVSAPQSIPGPRGLPLLGVMLDVKRDCLRYFVDLQRKYGDAVQYKVGFDRIMMVNLGNRYSGLDAKNEPLLKIDGVVP